VRALGGRFVTCWLRISGDGWPGASASGGFLPDADMAVVGPLVADWKIGGPAWAVWRIGEVMRVIGDGLAGRALDRSAGKSWVWRSTGTVGLVWQGETPRFPRRGVWREPGRSARGRRR